MVNIRELSRYKDAKGNEIRYEGQPITAGISITFRGSNNVVTISDRARIKKLILTFDCSNGRCDIGSNDGVAPLQTTIRVGENSQVKIGNNVSTTHTANFSAVEGTTITLGDDVMIASNVKVRCDDGHPIFDVHTGKRVNVARSIIINDHVWLGIDSSIMGGAEIGPGSVVGAKALVTKRFPNNCVIAGVPAKIIRRDIAWERPHLSVVAPPYKPDASTVECTPYWATTNDLVGD